MIDAISTDVGNAAAAQSTEAALRIRALAMELNSHVGRSGCKSRRWRDGTF